MTEFDADAHKVASPTSITKLTMLPRASCAMSRGSPPTSSTSKILDPGSNDDHPPTDIRAGQALVLEVYEALSRGPAWDDTLLVIVYDEHGGLYDHVPPPAIDDDSGYATLGIRVPALVVGPRVKQFVCHQTFDHTTLIKTILTRFAPDPDAAIARCPGASGMRSISGSHWATSRAPTSPAPKLSAPRSTPGGNRSRYPPRDPRGRALRRPGRGSASRTDRGHLSSSCLGTLEC
jgi:phospholipase C